MKIKYVIRPIFTHRKHVESNPRLLDHDGRTRLDARATWSSPLPFPPRIRQTEAQRNDKTCWMLQKNLLKQEVTTYPALPHGGSAKGSLPRPLSDFFFASVVWRSVVSLSSSARSLWLFLGLSAISTV